MSKFLSVPDEGIVLSWSRVRPADQSLAYIISIAFSFKIKKLYLYTHNISTDLYQSRVREIYEPGFHNIQL